jgi:UDP-2,3-diacylglucosamine pyrophosphatase LpxH
MVRIRLAELLGVQNEASYKFIYDGEAYTLSDVLIEHGNRYDKWNVVDFDRLRRFRSESSRRLTISGDASFEPPAGSQLVEQVMNLIKQDYPFIDLLKPETDAAVPLLLALEPRFANVMKSIEVARLGCAAMKHGLKGPARPSQPGDIASVARTEHQLDPLDEILRGHVNDDCRVELLKLADEAQQETSVTQQEIAQGIMRRALSLLRLKASGSLEARLKILLGTVRALQNDRAFDRSVETEKDLCDAARALGREGFTTVIFGHTHLAKSVRIDDTQYINTGTWADLIRVPPEIIHGMPTAAHEELERFTQAILDKQFDKYLLFQPTFAYVCFNSEHRAVRAGLYDYGSAVVQRL